MDTTENNQTRRETGTTEKKMIRTKLAKRMLTKKEQKHLTEAAINSMATLKRQIDFMKDDKFACFECKHIAAKLI